MKEQYENNWKDYYAILNVLHDTDFEKIQRVYKALAFVYHSDSNPNPSAIEKMKDLNEAYEVLKDSDRRRKYNYIWLQRQKEQPNQANAALTSGPPKPILDPSFIKIKNANPGQVQKAYFTVMNVGGPYSKINIDNPNSWVKVTQWRSLTETDELPLKVCIECQGKDWSSTYSENIRVKLDSAEAQIRVEFQTLSIIRDHVWHDLDYEDLKGWVKKRGLSPGQELAGRTFRYRCTSANKYQFRLRHSFRNAIYNPLDSPV
jgi:curved DNA-binding protein CbpA